MCPTEIIAFSDRIKEFDALKTAVVGVSVDSHFSHLAWINTPRKAGGLGDLQYPLLADITKQISVDYDVLIKEEGIALRGLYIIDPNGVIRQKTINDLPVGRSVDETLRLIQAIQHFEEHGEGLYLKYIFSTYPFVNRYEIRFFVREKKMFLFNFPFSRYSLSSQLEP